MDLFCDACGHLIKPNKDNPFLEDIPIKLYIYGEEKFFHNERCKARYERLQIQQNKVKTGKRANYGVTGI